MKLFNNKTTIRPLQTVVSDRSISTSSELGPSRFIKKRSPEWRLSPPPLKRQRQQPPAEDGNPSENTVPTTTTLNTTPQPSTFALIETQAITITDHSAYSAALLSPTTLNPYPAHSSRLPIQAYKSLYEPSLHSPTGAHVVIHQHDHPVAGLGHHVRPPGDPNGARQNRNATETRVHCLWNHVVETAGAETGSLLVWDTGTYAVLPRRSKHAPEVDPESESACGGRAGRGWDGAGEVGGCVCGEED
ncbi:hypothetical protein B0H67DRAFT_548373 [Lasiosphaeris hirsuta]|uniref:DNA ligase D 3'-phosphoesterase domain-containing protein n=1 Tax=Lasiosphaeris hirsuta TaxID=260670 RepID=A0AA40BA03_9PEZI|nr:hypothetical protein B0H67DRAFT_548373 [Lasiosphaeris hirsuta]